MPRGPSAGCASSTWCARTSDKLRAHCCNFIAESRSNLKLRRKPAVGILCNHIGRPNPRPTAEFPMRLSDYGMSRERGFLSPYEIDEVFVPTWFDPVIDTAQR